VLLFNAPLNSNVTLDTECNLPPAYKAALRYNLAVQVAPEFGRDAGMTVQLSALRALNSIATANFKVDRLQFDVSGGRYFITTDEVR
jgi:hypothetical protein